MIYLLSFLFAGTICFLGQLVYEKTKLSPGHITTFLVILGVFLGFLGIYEQLINIFGGGASVLITNFGYLLSKGVKEGVDNQGVVGIFLNIFKYSSLALSLTIFCSLIASFISRPRDH